jgi:hypothetical protein
MHHRAAGKVDADGAAKAGDEVTLCRGRTFGLRLLRERVLARSRRRLGLPEQSNLHSFAEVFEREPVAKYLGRLLSAQNHLAALGADSVSPSRVRDALDDALREGAQETLELLTFEVQADHAALEVVAEVLVEFGKRLSNQLSDPS